jgi:hypothetical protein
MLEAWLKIDNDSPYLSPIYRCFLEVLEYAGPILAQASPDTLAIGPSETVGDVQTIRTVTSTDFGSWTWVSFTKWRLSGL